MARSRESLQEALIEIPKIRERFWKEVFIPGSGTSFNQALEAAGRVADFLELGELLCRDALTREESCGGHFRIEYQLPDGEALRNDEQFSYAHAWQYQGEENEPALIKEPLNYEFVHPATRNYKN